MRETVALGPGPVLIVAPGWFPNDGGGANRYARSLAEQMAGSNDVRALVVGPATDAPSWVRTVSRLDRSTLARLAALALAGRVEARRSSVIDVHLALYGAAVRASRTARRLPLVVHFHGPWAHESSVAGDRRVVVAIKGLLEGRLYRRAGACLVLSSAFRRVLVERYGVDPFLVAVVPPGVDTNRFSPGDRSSARRSLGLADEGFVAVCARRLVARTGVDVLIRAWSGLVLEVPGARLLVVGDGSESAALRSAAAASDVADAISFLGVVDDETLVAAYRAADVAVVPSVALEGFGLVVLESLACGTPVIASDCGGLAEALSPLVNAGLLVPPGDVDALADRLVGAARGDLPARAACAEVGSVTTWEVAAEATRRAAIRAAASGEPPADDELRVVVLTHSARPAGAELSVAAQLPALTGVRTHVVVGEDGPLLGRLARSGVSSQVLPLPESARGVRRESSTRMLSAVRAAVGTAWCVIRLARRLRQWSPDVVVAGSLKSLVYGAAAARLAGVPLVWHLHDRVAPDYLPARTVALLRWAARHVPVEVVANSQATADTVPGASVTVIPEAVALVGLRDVDRVGHHSLRVGMIGRLSPWKGQDVFLTAFASAFPLGDEQAVIVGGAQFGEDVEEQLRALAEELGLAGRVIWRGHCDDVAAELAELDVVVHASTIPEPFGMVVVEAMASGLPVVVADAGGPAEVVEHGVTGLRYRMGDSEALADALRLLARDPDLRDSIGTAGRSASASYRPEALADAWERVLRRAARRETASP